MAVAEELFIIDFIALNRHRRALYDCYRPKPASRNTKMKRNQFLKTKVKRKKNYYVKEK